MSEKNGMEETDPQPSTSTCNNEVFERERPNEKSSKKDKKSNHRWSWVDRFTKSFKKSSEKSDKKLSKKSKSLSIDDNSSISSITDNKLERDSGGTGQWNTQDKDNNKSTPDKDDRQSTPDKDELASAEDNEPTPDEDNEPTPDEDDQPTAEFQRVKRSTTDKDSESSSGSDKEPLIEGDVASDIEEETSFSNHNTEQQGLSHSGPGPNGHKEDTKSSSDGDPELISHNDRLSEDVEYHNGHESSVTPLPGVDFDDGYVPNTCNKHEYENVENLRVTELSIEDQTEDGAEPKSERTEFEKILEHRLIVLRELVETEKTYVRDLSLVVDEIMVAMRDPESIGCDVQIPEELVRSEEDKLIFNNIKQIYEWHRYVFSSELEKCISQPHELGKLFKKYEREFGMYVDFCQKTTISECILLKHNDYFEKLKQFFGHILNFTDLLFKPLQRLMNYKQLLQEILKFTEQANLVDEVEALRPAIDVMENLIKQINDTMAVNRLKEFQGIIANQGKLLLQGNLTCSDRLNEDRGGKGTDRDLQVFLFEKVMIFSQEDDKQTDFNDPAYVYKAHIEVNKMAFDEPDSAGGSFVIKSVDDAELEFACHVNGEELRAKWLQTVRDLLKSCNVVADAPKLLPYDDVEEDTDSE